MNPIKSAVLNFFYLFDQVFEKLLANIFIWIIFSLVYFVVLKVKDGEDENGNPKERSITIEEAFYFSATTHYTIGFGDITPNNRAGKIAVIFHIFSSWTLALIPIGLEDMIVQKYGKKYAKPLTKVGVAGF